MAASKRDLREEGKKTSKVKMSDIHSRPVCFSIEEMMAPKMEILNHPVEGRESKQLNNSSSNREKNRCCQKGRRGETTNTGKRFITPRRMPRREQDSMYHRKKSRGCSSPTKRSRVSEMETPKGKEFVGGYR
ncbi:hypothetical protein SASPL_104780 [Salvia splendens]|uniref:Uncharacterized protein n=1 Tax=Salvia splendens TaxID=180675 RepID=A0A8X9A807_SALSN|nr:hypothetical protein SASPL_104780 [Salvia splendens]